MATSTAWNPLLPYSRWKFDITLDAAWQCGQVVKINSSATTLPRYWLISLSPCPGTVKASSGAFRGNSVSAPMATQAVIEKRTAHNQTFFNELYSKSLV